MEFVLHAGKINQYILKISLLNLNVIISKKCVTCVGSPDNCINGCSPPFLSLNNKCLESCPKGYTAKERTCILCDKDADSCIYDPITGSTIITECKIGKFLYQAKCLITCPNGYYGESIKKSCEACHVACERCIESTQRDCLTCNSAYGYVMVSDKFCDYPTCGSSMFFNTQSLKCEGNIL